MANYQFIASQNRWQLVTLFELEQMVCAVQDMNH